MRQNAVETAFVVGGGRLGARVANRLATAGEPVTLVTRDPDDTATSRDPPGTSPSAQSVELVDSIDGYSLESAGLGRASAVLALDENDATNLLVAQLARSRFDVDRVLVRVNDPGREPAFENVDVDTVDTAAVLADAVVDQW
jgi:trk system potassium uptake protein TrkA